MKTEDRKS